MRKSSALARVIAIAGIVLIAASCGGTVGTGSASTPEPASGAPAVSAGPPAALWPAPSDPSERAVAAGLELDREEGSSNHAHSHLDVFSEQPCISPLHTHDDTGVLHTESEDMEPHSLGQFFTEWGVELSQTCVAEHCAPTPIQVYVGGQPFSGDPATIALTDEKVIVIVIGTPPAEIPSTYDFSNA